ncbi:MAG: hypothetical protein ACTSSE_14185 [Candidatus Thorarchaeota archaeon]
MTPSASDHTILVNNIIAMLSPNHSWPSPLFDMGYRLLSIEEMFNVGTEGSNPCNPDIISVESVKNTVMLLECKGGKNVDENQLQNYLSVTPPDIVQLVTVNDQKIVSIHIVYVARKVSDLKKSINLTLKKIRKNGIIAEVPKDIDIIESTDQIIRVYTSNERRWPSTMINGIQISEGTFPMHYYPFSEDDDGDYILGEVIRLILHLISNKPSINPDEIVLTTDEVLLDIFDAHSYISNHQKRKVKRQVDICFSKLIKEKSLKGKIYRISTKGKSLSVKKSKEIREDLIKLGMEIQEGFKQAPLEDFFDL